MVKRKITKRKQIAHAMVEHEHEQESNSTDGSAGGNGNGTTKERSEILRLPVEILGMIGELIQGRLSLQALVATCRSFRQIYEPFLYADLTYNLHKLNPVRPRYIELPPGISLIKHLSILVDEFGSERRAGVMYDAKSMNDNYARYLARLINEATGLLTFCWHCRSWDAREIALILQNKTLLKALRAAPKLENLCISFEALLSEDNDPLDLRYAKPSISLVGFGGLNSLELYNLSGKQDELVNDLAAVLARSPKLKTLGLGLACHAEWDVFPESMIYAGQCDFLEKLCVAYMIVSKGALLLKTLKLGWAMCVFESESPERGNFLELLFELPELRTLHIYNGFVQLGSSDARTEILPIKWDLLKDCTALHQLAVNRLEGDLRDWLNSTATNLKELIFADRNGMMHGAAQAFLPTLDHSLSCLVATEDGYMCRAHEEFDSDSSDTDSSDSLDSSTDSDSDTSDGPRDGIGLPPNRERTSISTTLGSKVLKVSDKVATVLDRLKDGGTHLTHLALSIDFEVQWKHFTARLETLKDLTHLRLMRRTWKSGPWPAKGNSLWEGVYEAQQIALKYAQLIKTLCPSIQFVMIKDWAWQFILQPDPSKVNEDDQNSKYLAVELEWTESTKIPIFAQDPVDTQAGLPINDLDGPYFPDWAQMEAIEKIVQEKMTAWRAENPYGTWDDFHYSD